MSKEDTFRIEGTDLVMRGIDAPLGFWECNDLQERQEVIKRNLRAILQLFNIKVFIFPERVEVRGTIPTQVLDMSSHKQAQTALVISSPSLTKGGGRILEERLRLSLTLLQNPASDRRLQMLSIGSSLSPSSPTSSTSR